MLRVGHSTLCQDRYATPRFPNLDVGLSDLSSHSRKKGSPNHRPTPPPRLQNRAYGDSRAGRCPHARSPVCPPFQPALPATNTSSTFVGFVRMCCDVAAAMIASIALRLGSMPYGSGSPTIDAVRFIAASASSVLSASL